MEIRVRRSPQRFLELLAWAVAGAIAPVASAHWSADESRFMAATESAIVLFDARTGRVERAFPRHVTLARTSSARAEDLLPVSAAEFSGDPVLLSRSGKRLATNAEGALHVWEVDEEAGKLCREIAYLRMEAVRVYEGGECLGIRVRRIAGNAPGRWPFEPGDVLLNSVRCRPEGCAPEDFLRDLNHLCSIPGEKMLHELRLEVRSADPRRNRDYILRRPGAAPTS